MTADPRGRWFRVYARQVRQHPKFRDLNVTQLGAWLVLRAEAELRDGAVFADRADAVLTLRRRKTPRPAGMLDGLMALALFDLQEDGSIAVHDRKDHDRQSFPSDDPEETRRRKAEERARKAADRAQEDGSHEVVTTRDGEGHDSPRAHAHSGAEAGAVSEADTENGNARAELDGPDEWDTDSVVTYHTLTGKYPKPTVLDWLNKLSDAHPEEAISQVMAEEWAKDPDILTLIGRTESVLKLDARRRDKASKKAQEDYQRRLAEEHRAKVVNATPEQREQAKLQQQAIRIGLSMGVEVPTDPAEVRKFVMKHGSSAA